ncbi:ROK family transcriptional regulator [Thalassobacillus devorans]|uniref:ROK family transcriptional regulator n=1 Tax=Thalassobacillus devorans TaxID=279813 RepID=UPI0004AE288E|nr:ROK family transcriptional regulator [Thalassobacillus devorans]
MNTGDASYIKKLNRRILIEEIIKNVSLSRSDLARKTGLNKATVSAQINDLIQDNIVIEKSSGTSVTRGRKPIILEINGNAGYSIGIDMDKDKVNVVFCDLKGNLFHKLNLKMESKDISLVVNQIINQLEPEIAYFNKKKCPIGLIGIGVGIHGIVNVEDDIIYTPKEKWTNVNIIPVLEEAFQTNVYVDNNANLSVYAEQVYYEHISDLFCVTLYSGIGLGIISDHKIYRGFQGFAGEIGHMIVEPGGHQCACGNKGCWELYASEKALEENLTKANPTLSIDESLEKLLKADTDDKVLNDYLDYLAIGLNNIINIFNPEKIVFNGTFINKHSTILTKLENRLRSKFNNYKQIRSSYLGTEACALGGAALALKNFFRVNTVHHVNATVLKKEDIRD